MQSLAEKFRETQHTVIIDCPENLIITGYPETFFQIFSQLILNSIVHGFNGIDAGTITIAVRYEKNILTILYSDNGRGMDNETLKQVFDPFFTTRRNLGGIGLGMHIVYNLVTSFLGGEIRCYSTPENGTSFTIILPLINP